MEYVKTAKRKMPSVTAIQEHWAERMVEWGKADSVFEVMEEPGWCFACGSFIQNKDRTEFVKPERAHILARIHGGSDDCENLHLLCGTCHKASEYVNGDSYWEWFHSRTWLDVVIQECLMHGMNLSGLIRGDQA